MMWVEGGDDEVYDILDSVEDAVRHVARSLRLAVVGGGDRVQ